jgi:hypothetical protein
MLELHTIQPLDYLPLNLDSLPGQVYPLRQDGRIRLTLSVIKPYRHRKAVDYAALLQALEVHLYTLFDSPYVSTFSSHMWYIPRG